MKINIQNAQPFSVFYHKEMLILSFEEFNNNFDIDHKAMSNIKIEHIGRDISLIPTKIIMSGQRPDSVAIFEFNTIVNLHQTEGTQRVLAIRREGGPVYYFDIFGVKTPPLLLE